MVRPFVLSLCFVLFWALCLGENVAGAERLTSTGCPSLRWGVYPARLDLFYFYLVEFDNTTTPDLQGIERAIAVGLVDTLSYKGCNVYGEPVMAVELTEDGHRYSSGGELKQSRCLHSWTKASES